ncbi:hypothetical protein GC169_06185 [bacterium]|nr:hypothetical protein [bacterium]
MPLHAQIICIGGNALLALLFAVAALAGGGDENAPPMLLMLAFAGVCAYSAWVLIKFRNFLAAEAERGRGAQRPDLYVIKTPDTASRDDSSRDDSQDDPPTGAGGKLH